MKRVWFMFKILEAVLGLCCLGYHTRGFLNINYIQDHYMYVSVFAGFSLMAMYGCFRICMKKRVNPFWEGAMNLIAAISFISISMNSMYHAEKDFHLMYLSADIDNYIDDDDGHEVGAEHAHPFFKYSKAQSLASLCCGSLFLLHSILAFDLAIVDRKPEIEESGGDEDETNNERRLILYVFGEKVHNWLEKYEWFKTLADEKEEQASQIVMQNI